MQPKTRNYLKHRASLAGQRQPTQQGRLVRVLPDETIHHPPGALLILGALGVLAGALGNLWQPFTTFIAFWGMFNPTGSLVDVQKQPGIDFICGLIAIGAQFALLFMVFRIESPWKKFKVTGQKPGVVPTGFKATAVEIVQHVSMVVVWGILGFVVDTIGDFGFASAYTSKLDFWTSTFLVFIYGAFLYAITTIGFVKSIECIWAGFAASDNLKAQQKQPPAHQQQTQQLPTTPAGNSTGN